MRTLDQLESILMEKEIVCSRIDGTVPPRERSQKIDDFQRNPETAVLLMTIGTGAVGYVR
jgi:SNF2 family DNA or RNA helicase